MIRSGFIFLILIFFRILSPAQDSDSTNTVEFKGYFKDIQSSIFSDINKDWLNSNMILNRLSFQWRPNSEFTTQIDLRNRFVYGDFITRFTSYDSLLNLDDGFMYLTGNVLHEQSFLLNLNVDRLWADYSLGNFQLTLGRQRINWGQTFVWNPNDIFNTYNYFDFDYEEKPGSDAIRIQYYTSADSRWELALKLNHEKKITTATLYSFNWKSYDFQMIGGLYNETDWMGGLGWSGQVLNGGFRGEISYFHPDKNAADTSGILVVSLGYDYTFSNSLFFQCEALYNGSGSNSDSFDINQMYYQKLSPENLNISRISLFTALSCPVTPLINTTLAGLYSPNNKLLFIMPSIDFSIARDFDFSISAQHFFIADKTHNNTAGTFVFLKFRWSF